MEQQYWRLLSEQVALLHYSTCKKHKYSKTTHSKVYVKVKYLTENDKWLCQFRLISQWAVATHGMWVLVYYLWRQLWISHLVAYSYQDCFSIIYLLMPVFTGLKTKQTPIITVTMVRVHQYRWYQCQVSEPKPDTGTGTRKIHDGTTAPIWFI